MGPMNRAFHLVLLIAFTLGTLVAPKVSLARSVEMSMAQTSSGDLGALPCDGCVGSEMSDGVVCEAECAVPCGAGVGSAAVLPVVAWPPRVLSRMFMPPLLAVPVLRNLKHVLDPQPPKYFV